MEINAMHLINEFAGKSCSLIFGMYYDYASTVAEGEKVGGGEPKKGIWGQSLLEKSKS